MPKNLVENEGPQMTSQYGALHAGLARLHACTRLLTLTLPSTHMHARTHAYRDQYVVLIAFRRRQWLGERALMFRYTYIAPLLPYD